MIIWKLKQDSIFFNEEENIKRFDIAQIALRELAILSLI